MMKPYFTCAASAAAVALAVVAADSAIQPTPPNAAPNGSATRPDLSTADQLRGQDPESADVTVIGHVVEPKQLDATDERVQDLKLPEGFAIHKWATDLGHPRMLLVTPAGHVYVTRRDPGDVLLLSDANGDGRADGEAKIVAQQPHLHGIALSPDGQTMYLTAIRKLWSAPIREDGTLGELTELISDLPDAGQHPNRTMAFGPDGKLYLSVGSTANATDEQNPENATIVQVEPDGSGRRVWASGLRNTIGFGWHPETGEMWGADHGIDWLGDDEQGEEFNKLEEGEFYGWPWIYADGKYNPADDPPAGETMADVANRAREPALLYTAHSAPMQMTFYTGDLFPAEYKNDAFLAMRGSWNRKPPAGYEVVRVTFDDSGAPTAMEPFITGWLVSMGEDKWAHFGRLAGIAQMPDGSLLLSDDTNGVIYRISYEGESTPDRMTP